MATYNIDKITSPSGDVYKLQDKVSGFTTNTGTVTQVTAGTGLKIGTASSGGSITTTGTINHINSVTAGTVGTSSATSGSTLAVPYITYDAQGHITATGTHTHTITGSGLQNLKDGNAYGSLIQGSVISTPNAAVYSYTGGYKDSDISYDGGFVIYPTIKTGTLTYVSTDNSNGYSQGKYQLTINSGSIHDIYINDMICFTEQVIGNSFVLSNDYSTFRITSIDYDTSLITLYTVSPGGSDYDNVTDTTLNNTPVYIIDSLSASAYYADYEIKDIIYSAGVLTADLSNIDNDCHKITIAHGNGVTLDISSGDYFIDNNGMISIIVKVIDSTNFVTCILSESVGHSESDFTNFDIGRGCYYFKYIDNHGAFGGASQVGGYNSEAYGAFSYAFGNNIIASKSNQYVIGKYNKIDTCGLRPINGSYATNWIETEGMGISRGKYAFIIGNGTSHTNRSNALTVDWYGNLEVSGDIALSDGKGVYSKDSTGRAFGMIADNGNNFWIGAASSDMPHHSGVNGYTYISSGYNTSNSTGNDTAYIWVPSLTNSTWGGTGYGILHSGNYSNYTLPLTGGTLTGNLVIGSTSDTVARNLTIRNSLGNIALNVDNAGRHGLYSNTKAGWLLFANNSANSTDDILYIPRSAAVYEKLLVGTGIGVNKTTQQEARAGFWANTAGNLYLTGDTNTGSYIYFYYNKAVSATSYIREESSNHLYTNAYFRAKLYNETVGQVVGSVPTDGNRIAYFSSNATTLFINGQHGTTGSTFANKNITFNTSDVRLKTNITDTKVNALDVINKIRIREFDWTDERKDKHQAIGMVADEIEKLDKKFAVGGGYDEEGCMNIKSVDTFYLTGYLTKGIQELSGKVDDHDDRIAALEKENKELRKEIEELKKEMLTFDAKISYLLDKTR